MSWRGVTGLRECIAKHLSTTIIVACFLFSPVVALSFLSPMAITIVDVTAIDDDDDSAKRSGIGRTWLVKRSSGTNRAGGQAPATVGHRLDALPVPRLGRTRTIYNPHSSFYALLTAQRNKRKRTELKNSIKSENSLNRQKVIKKKRKEIVKDHNHYHHHHHHHRGSNKTKQTVNQAQLHSRSPSRRLRRFLSLLRLINDWTSVTNLPTSRNSSDPSSLSATFRLVDDGAPAT